jgi:phospholipase C
MFDFDDRDEDGPRKLVLDEATGVVVSATRGDDGDHDRDHDRR